MMDMKDAVPHLLEAVKEAKSILEIHQESLKLIAVMFGETSKEIYLLKNRVDVLETITKQLEQQITTDIPPDVQEFLQQEGN